MKNLLFHVQFFYFRRSSNFKIIILKNIHPCENLLPCLKQIIIWIEDLKIWKSNNVLSSINKQVVDLLFKRK